MSIIDNNEVNPSTKFAIETLKSQGYEPIVVNEIIVWKSKLIEMDNLEVVNFLETMSKFYYFY
jgi:hypothetical protein